MANLIGNNQFPISSFNSPIGYSKNPLLYGQQHNHDESTNASGTTTPIIDEQPSSATITSHNVSLTTPPKELTFDKLPYEIRSQVANELSQFDCIKLLLVNKAIYASTITRLYQYIIIDEDYNSFNNEKEYNYRRYERDNKYRSQFSCTFINSSYNLKRFIRVYNTKFMKEHSFDGIDENFPHIRRFECIKIPDSLNIYDYELNDQLILFFKHLICLRQLIWLNDNFRLEFLYNLKNKYLINTLVLNIKFSNYLNELNDANELDDYSKLTFPNIINFQIQPFHNSKKLMKIINNLLINRHDPVDVSSNLRSLVLSKYHKSYDNNILLPNCRDLIGFTSSNNNNDINNINNNNNFTVHTTLHEIDLKSISSLFRFSKLKYLSNLTTLSLDNILITPEDSQIFINAINLPHLTSLSLRGISEYQIISDEAFGTRDRNVILEYLKPSFLEHIAPHLHNLRHLSIDYRQTYIDSVPLFIQTIPSKSLKSLDLLIRLNHTKPLSNHEDELKFYNEYQLAILTHAKTLNKLSIELRQEIDNYSDSNNLNILVSIPSRIHFYSDLVQLTSLTSLRINPGDNVDEFLYLIKNLHSLKKLDIFGSKAGGSPNLGLGMIHPSIYDEWYKVQHVALFYLQCNAHIDYIRINSCIFECNGINLQINPRYGITRWFDRHIRPTNELT
ncbi:hypothetical protein DFJ63DRAFT_54140 [Scheffersomyces coipomensis]|uniref:uncharacterized protein n=1 Tax=Scheffersomyces coipomensis TaxID=1788519 RepID=UPI00315DC378